MHPSVADTGVELEKMEAGICCGINNGRTTTTTSTNTKNIYLVNLADFLPPHPPCVHMICATSPLRSSPLSISLALAGHLNPAGGKVCDHFHEGAGFVTSHVAISLMFEQSLQAIDPSIALPYWDFTIEATYYDWSNFRRFSIFSDDWFGGAAPQNVRERLG